jgi:hypothetical protein
MKAIYLLTCPLTGAPKYVGQSTDPELRIGAHISFAKARGRVLERSRGRSTGPTVERWVLSLVNNNKRPLLTILEWCADRRADEREVWWINRYFNEGADLTNDRVPCWVRGRKWHNPRR